MIIRGMRPIFLIGLAASCLCARAARPGAPTGAGAQADRPDSLLALEELLLDGGITEAELRDASVRGTGLRTGRAGWRGVLSAGAGAVGGRLDWRSRDARAGWKYRRSGDDPDTGGFLFGGIRGCRAGVGYHSLSFGYGLLMAGAGGWNALTAGGTLLPARSSWRGYAGSASGHGLWGAGVEVGGRPGAIRMLRTVDRRGRTGDGGATTLIAADLGGPDRGLGALLLRDARGRGWSVAARCGGMAFEATGWRPTQGGKRMLGAAAGASCSGPRWTLSTQFVCTSSASVSPFARRPASLKAWGGGSWAISGRWRPSAEQAFALLLSGHAAPAGVANDYSRRDGTVIAIEMKRRFAGGVRILTRIKRDRERSAGWEERSAWLPAAGTAAGRRIHASASLEFETASTDYRLVYRYLEIEKGASGEAAETGDRSLVSLKARTVIGRDWRFDTSCAWAWGGSADLMSVAAPATGLVLPLHWGHWCEGIDVGLSRTGGRLVVGAGLLFRISERETSGVTPREPDLRCLVSARMRW